MSENVKRVNVQRVNAYLGNALGLGALACGALAAACYGFTLQLPFFFDDLPIMTWLSRHTWADIWRLSSENAYYRPLAFTVYKLGCCLPMGSRQVVLHLVSVLMHWAGGLLVMHVVNLYHRPVRAVLAGLLFVVFPFMFRAVPWITALSHPMVSLLALLAVYAALRAERGGAARWWAISLLATSLAPFAHESGPVCGLIVAGVVTIQCGLNASPAGRRRLLGIVAGVLLNVGGVLWRSQVPGTNKIELLGLVDWLQNTLFFLHGLVYPLGPIIGWLVHQHGWHDFTLVGVTALGVCLLLAWLAFRRRGWRWVACSLWWWACGALPAATSIRYEGLFISPRLHALASAGVVMLWAGIIVELGDLVRSTWGRRLVWGVLGGAIIAHNTAFLAQQAALHLALNQVYQGVLQAAADKQNAPLGFVNLPAWLARRDATYALVTEGVLFLPGYSNIGEFIQVNLGWRVADNVMFMPVLEEDERVAFGFHGPALEWEQMYGFSAQHTSVWLSRYEQGRFVLDYVGTVQPGQSPSGEPLARFEGGPVIEAASARRVAGQRWAITLTWLAAGPVDGGIFVHVRDAAGQLVAQADGPALGWMVPIWLWQAGDRIQDVRYVDLPAGGGPYSVQIGLYNAAGRFAAFVGDRRCPDDAAPLVEIVP